MTGKLAIGLTGGIASGKSLVGSAFERLGVDVIDADQVARDVVEPGEPALAEISARFGDDVIDESGSLARRKLRAIVFSDDAARADLEAITHPRIRAELARGSLVQVLPGWAPRVEVIHAGGSGGYHLDPVGGAARAGSCPPSPTPSS